MAQSDSPPNAFEFRKVAIIGASTPGGGTFEQFGAPVINNLGTCAFWANGSGFLEAGVYRSTLAGATSLLLPELAGIDDYRYEEHIDETLMINDQDHVAFVAHMTDGPDPAHDGDWILRFRGLGPEVMMRRGDPAPTTAGGTLGTLSNPDRLAFNNAGEIAFVVRINTPMGEGIFRTSRNGLVAIARTGDPSPHGGTIAAFHNISLGNDGFVTFTYSATGATTSIGIARGNGNGDPLQLLVNPQQPAPGGQLVAITKFDAAFNNAGHVLFQGTLKVGMPEYEALFVHDNNGLRVLAREGLPSPDGTPWSHAFTPMAMDETNRAIFRGYLTSAATESGVYADDGELHLLARDDTFAPGYWTGHQFIDFQYTLAGNNLGNVAVLGVLSIPFYDGIWATDARDDLHEVTRLGTPFEYAPGFYFAPTQLKVHTTNHGAATGHTALNDRRELAFATDLGVYVAILNAADCNDNTIADADEIAGQPILDLNGDGSLDMCQSYCPADFVASDSFAPPPDGKVDGADLAYLLGAWGSHASLADMVTSATLQPPPDGAVDAADLAILLGFWGPCQ